MRPPMLTSCFDADVGLRRRSALPFCFIQAGCCGTGVAALGFGDSGLFRALSSQLDFVGLHLLGSMVFEGLEGGGVSGRFGVASGSSC